MILLAGFEPFLGQAINPSEKIVQYFAQKYPERVTPLILPVSYQRSVQVLQKYLQLEWDFILLTGQASGRAQVCLEKVALNLMDSSKADADGVIHLNSRIDPKGPEARFTSVDIRELQQKAQEQNLPMELSYSAGVYVCNRIYYEALVHHAQKTLFVHVPLLPEQVSAEQNLPIMNFSEMLKCFEIILAALNY